MIYHRLHTTVDQVRNSVPWWHWSRGRKKGLRLTAQIMTTTSTHSVKLAFKFLGCQSARAAVGQSPRPIHSGASWIEFVSVYETKAGSDWDQENLKATLMYSALCYIPQAIPEGVTVITTMGLHWCLGRWCISGTLMNAGTQRFPAELCTVTRWSVILISPVSGFFCCCWAVQTWTVKKHVKSCSGELVSGRTPCPHLSRWDVVWDALQHANEAVLQIHHTNHRKALIGQRLTPVFTVHIPVLRKRQGLYTKTLSEQLMTM